MAACDGKLSTEAYQRFLNWAEKDPTRRILTEEEYERRMAGFRIRLSPIESHLRDLERNAVQQYTALMSTLAELKEVMAKYRADIERALTE